MSRPEKRRESFRGTGDVLDHISHQGAGSNPVLRSVIRYHFIPLGPLVNLTTRLIEPRILHQCVHVYTKPTRAFLSAVLIQAPVVIQMKRVVNPKTFHEKHNSRVVDIPDTKCGSIFVIQFIY